MAAIRRLLAHWQAQPRPDGPGRTVNVTLSLADAARLAALAELYPQKSEQALLRELIGAALDDLEAAFPYVVGERVIAEDELGDPIFEDAGLTPRFIALTRKHRARLERECRQDEASPSVPDE